MDRTKVEKPLGGLSTKHGEPVLMIRLAGVDA